MGSQTNDSYYTLPLCRHSDNVCNSQYVSALMILLNVFSVILNLLHALILGQLKYIKRTVFVKILLHITAIDAFASLIFALIEVCPLRLVTQGNLYLAAMYRSVLYYGGIKYVIFAVATTERAIALSKPLAYGCHPLVKHLNKILVATWVVIPLATIILSFIHTDGLCMDEVIGPTFFSLPLALLCVLVVGLPTIIALISQGKVIQELYRVWQGSVQRCDAAGKSALAAARLITIFVILFVMLCMMPVGIALLIRFLRLPTKRIDTFELFLHTLDNLSNPIIYALSSKPYRKLIVKKLCPQRYICNSVNSEI